MTPIRRAILMMVLAASAAAFVVAQSEKLDFAMLGRIRDEGLNRSQVMDHVSWLSDVYGPRLTGSPGIQQASEWTMKKFREWGLVNVHQERWSFGKGWSMDTFDRVQRGDMVQQATVIAVFAYDAAMRDEKLPRKALPAPQKGRGSTDGQ